MSATTANPPKIFLSQSRKISQLQVELSKAEATIRNQQIEISRLNQQIAEYKSLGWTTP